STRCLSVSFFLVAAAAAASALPNTLVCSSSLTSAPCSTRYLTVSVFPVAAAAASALPYNPVCSSRLTSAPCSTRYLTVSIFPLGSAAAGGRQEDTALCSSSQTTATSARRELEVSL